MHKDKPYTLLYFYIWYFINIYKDHIYKVLLQHKKGVFRRIKKFHVSRNLDNKIVWSVGINHSFSRLFSTERQKQNKTVK